MPRIHTYLNFDGDAMEAMEFYREVVGGEFTSVVRFRDMPMEGFHVPDDEQDKMMHVGLAVSDDDVLMASDILQSHGQTHVVGNNAYVSIHPDSREDADRIFTGLSKDGDVEMPIDDQPWGDYYGSLTDRYGVRWMVNYGQPEG